MTVDEIMHRADEMIRYVIRFNGCPLGYYPSFEYCYFGDYLYLIRNKRSGFMMFVHARIPKEAIETMIEKMKKGGLYVDKVTE